MLVCELIEVLRQYPAGLRVVVNDYDDLTPERISTAKISLDTGKHQWEGRHGDPRFLEEKTLKRAELVESLVLRRTSN